MNNQTQEALKMAIGQLQVLTNSFMATKEWVGTYTFDTTKETIDACKETLEQPAWQGLTDEHLLGQLFGIRFQRHTENLMSNPPQIKYSYTIQESDLIKFARAIEQAHGIGVKE